MRDYAKVVIDPCYVQAVARNMGILMTLFDAEDFLDRHGPEIQDAMYEAGAGLVRSRLWDEENEEAKFAAFDSSKASARRSCLSDSVGVQEPRGSDRVMCCKGGEHLASNKNSI